MASPLFPEPPPAVPPTTLAEIDRLVDKLASRKDAWVKTGIPRRIALLEACIASTTRVAEEWVELACKAKGIALGSQQAGEEWLGGPVTTVRNLRLLIDALEAGLVNELVPDQELFDVAINDVWICRGSGIGESIDLVDLEPRSVTVTIDLKSGDAEATIWTNDLTHAYVHENSAYST